MERISYAAGFVHTGTEISRAVLAYAETLARHATSATVDIPTRDEDGRESRANILLGPASQIIAEKYDDDQPEIVDAALVEKIYDHMKRLEGGRAQPSDLQDLENRDIYEDLV